VPWDKKPHRRVISKSFIEESQRILKKDGRLELRTDSQNYYEYSYELFTSLNQVEFIVRKNMDLPINSKYEDRWKRMEKNIYDLILINQIHSPPKEFGKSLKFQKDIDLAKLKKRFKNIVIKGDDFFVHFERLYEVKDKNIAVIKLSFGANEACEHKYLIFNNNKIQYFPFESLPTKQNLKAHQKIEEFLYE
jgi:tRNA (guanine-N7-)-methyltransferase